MCTVSMITDGWKDQFPGRWPQVVMPQLDLTLISRKEFDDLKKEVEELKKLLLAAKSFDEKTGQPNCEMEEKVNLVKSIAKAVGVSMDDVFGANK